MRSTPLLFIVFALALGGCSRTTADDLVVQVTASYPGADAQVVADTVAAPIEVQIDGIEGMTRVESESRNDGSYVARVRFGPQNDAKLVVSLVRDRVALARPVLPELVAQVGVEVKIGATQLDEKNLAVIALMDRGDYGRDALRNWSEAVVSRLIADGAMVNPKVFPGPDEKRARLLRIDRDTCARLGLSEAEVYEALRKAGGWAATPDALKKLTVVSSKGDQVLLSAVAVFEEVTGPAAVYRVDLHPAVRISGSPPEGTTIAETARRCVDLAEAERRKSKRPDGFAAINLTAK